MPFGVAHILFPLVVLEIVRKRSKRIQKSLTSKDLFIAGVAGIMPDADIIFEVIYFLFVGGIWGIHRDFTHLLIIPSIFLIASVVSWKKKKISILLLMIAFGWGSHIILDLLLNGQFSPLAPFINTELGLNLFGRSSPKETMYLLASLDAAFFLAWLWHEQKYKKIKDFL